MKEQDMRAVEGMIRCGIDLEGLCSVFHSFFEGRSGKVIA